MAEIADGVALAAKAGDAEVFDLANIKAYVPGMRKEMAPYWTDVDSKADLEKAKHLLIENASKGASDFLAYYLHKPIENKLIYWLSETRITPNQLTILVNLLAYFITALFFSGHLLLASILTFVVGILDGLDGKLSRVKNKSTKLGSMEHTFDFLYECSWFIALALNLKLAGENFQLMSGLELSPLALCVFIILFVAFYRNCYDRFSRATGISLDDWGPFERIFRRVAGRRNLYNLPILVFVLLGMPIYSLVFIFFHSLLTAVIYSWRTCKHLWKEDKKLAR
jgi:phosphatidylglycerophosphate synthase